MPISPRDFEKACRTYGLKWLGAENDGKTVSNRLDELQTAVALAKDGIAKLAEEMLRLPTIIEMLADEIERLSPSLTEAHVKELIAAAILAQHPLEPEVEPPPVVEEQPILLMEGDPAPIVLTEDGDELLLTEAR